MSDHCCAPQPPSANLRYRRILWIALAINAAMFVFEIAGSWAAGSIALLADAVDFAGDAANYGLSLFVLALAPMACLCSVQRRGTRSKVSCRSRQPWASSVLWR